MRSFFLVLTSSHPCTVQLFIFEWSVPILPHIQSIPCSILSWLGLVKLGQVKLGLVRLGKVRFGLVWLGVRLDLLWFDLVRLG